jgi:hypothetical protein
MVDVYVHEEVIGVLELGAVIRGRDYFLIRGNDK